MVISRITLFSSDIDKTAEFYKAIGLNLAKSVHGWGPHYSYLDILKNGTQDIIFQIFSLDAGHMIAPQNLGFDVEDLSSVIGKLIEMKAPLLRPFILMKHPEMRDGCTRAVFKDPDGRTVSLTQHGKVKSA